MQHLVCKRQWILNHLRHPPITLLRKILESAALGAPEDSIVKGCGTKDGDGGVDHAPNGLVDTKQFP